MQSKKTIYILLAMLLGLLLAGLAHASIELWFVNMMLARGFELQTHDFLGMRLYMPPLQQFGLLPVGVIGGYFLGQTWWQIVYIEHRHWRMHKK